MKIALKIAKMPRVLAGAAILLPLAAGAQTQSPTPPPAAEPPAGVVKENPTPAPSAGYQPSLFGDEDRRWETEKRGLQRELEREQLNAAIAAAKASQRTANGNGAADFAGSLPPLPSTLGGKADQGKAAPGEEKPEAAVPSYHIIGASVPADRPAEILLLVGTSQTRRTVGDKLPDGSTIISIDLDKLVVRNSQKKVVSVPIE